MTSSNDHLSCVSSVDILSDGNAPARPGRHAALSDMTRVTTDHVVVVLLCRAVCARTRASSLCDIPRLLCSVVQTRRIVFGIREVSRYVNTQSLVVVIVSRNCNAKGLSTICYSSTLCVSVLCSG